MPQLFNRQGVARTANSRDGEQSFYVARRNCTRCGGQGGLEQWRHTGFTCFRCSGNGNDPTPLREKLYTAEQNAKLDEIAAKKLAKRVAAKVEKDRLAQEFRDSRRAEVISKYEVLLARIDAELAYGESDILTSVRNTIREWAADPSEKQLEAVDKIIASRSAERARKAGAAHVGEIGKRQDFTLTLLHTQTTEIGQFPMIYSHWTLFTDENGCKIACKSAPWTIGLVRTYDKDGSGDWYYERKQVIRVKATVVQHTSSKDGEPLTYINRPKALT